MFNAYQYFNQFFCHTVDLTFPVRPRQERGC